MSFPASKEANELQEELQRGILAALSGEKEIHVKVKESEKAKTAANSYAADFPLAGADGVVQTVFIDPVAKAGRAHGERDQRLRGWTGMAIFADVSKRVIVMAENLLNVWPLLNKQNERDLGRIMDSPFCPLWGP